MPEAPSTLESMVRYSHQQISLRIAAVLLKETDQLSPHRCHQIAGAITAGLASTDMGPYMATIAGVRMAPELFEQFEMTFAPVVRKPHGDPLGAEALGPKAGDES